MLKFILYIAEFDLTEYARVEFGVTESAIAEFGIKCWCREFQIAESGTKCGCREFQIAEFDITEFGQTKSAIAKIWCNV